MSEDRDDGRDVATKGPDAFRTISEVADELGLPQHVLRFWEGRFPQIKPVKRGGGRRYYRPNDVELLRGVKQLLYGEGYTIRGVQRILREQGGRRIAQAAGSGAAASQEPDLGPAPSVEAAGPELWAPQRAVHSAPPREPTLIDEPPAFDPDPPVRDVPRASQTVAEPQQPPRQILSGEQKLRLTSALDELLACRRLLDGQA